VADEAITSRSGILRETFGVAIAFLIAWVAICHGLNRVALIGPDEGRNAEVAREMEHSREWLIPTYNGVVYLDKPAFFFKAVALSLAAFGDTELAARIPSALSAFALLAIVYAFCRRIYNARCAATAVVVIATTPLFLAYSRVVIFDMMLTLFTCAAILAGFLAEENDGARRRNWYLLAAVAAALATLVKGPVGFIVPALVLLISNRINRRAGSFRRLFSPLNLLVFFLIVLPWFIGVSLAHPDFPRYGIIEESFRRFSTGSFHRSKPIYYYPYIVATTFFPWNLLLPGYFIMAWKRRAEWSRIDRFCIVWSIAVLIFFSFSNSKMPGYILSLTVSLGILLARMLDLALEFADRDLRRIPLQAAAFLAGISVISGSAVIYLGGHLPNFEQRFRLHPGDVEQLLQFRVPLALFFILVSLLSIAALLRRSVRISFAAIVSFPTAAILLNLGVLEFVAARRSARDLSIELTSAAANARVACLECLPHGISFYLRRSVTVFSNDGEEFSSNYLLFKLKTGSPWPSSLVPLANRDVWLDHQIEPVALIARAKSKSALEEIAAKRGGRVVPLTRDYCALLLPARKTV
jgi:4-amino-4-deoxy-L-arabinose transferase-like glycosyltransferase